jgi:adiponectin receptor
MKIDEPSFFRLISASISTIVYYGFNCHPNIGYIFLALSFATGLAGNIFPFMAWFNRTEHRVRMVTS